MYSIVIVLFFFGLPVTVIYIFLIWNFNYWKSRGIKTAESRPFVGSFPSKFNKKRNYAYDIDDIYQKHKGTDNIVGVINTRLPQLLITSPEYAHKIFVSDFRSFHDNETSKSVNKNVDTILGNNPFVLTGDDWKERRAEITPGLSANRVSSVYPVTQNVCRQFVDYIKRQQRISSSDGLNGKDLCLCYTTEVVASCVLGISAKSFTENPTPLMTMTKRVFEQSSVFYYFAMVANLWPSIRKFYNVKLFVKEVEQFFFDLMQRCLDLRRQDPALQDRPDFLNYMLHLQDKKGLNTLEVTTHTMTFLTDGFETTALVLSHALLLLGRYPAKQQNLRDEIGKNNLTFEQLSALPLLDACINETLRLFPPLLSARKIVTETYDFVNKNGVRVRVEPGDIVIIPVRSLHYDPEYYDDPEEFKPERFLHINGGVRKYIDQGVFFGFGDGPRICPGMRFALTQVKAALVEILQNFIIQVSPKTREDNALHNTYFMAMLKDGIWLNFEDIQCT
ncbi:probable cytochrome P450 28d1 [Drosophila willistoni]|uniref:probable cytochrome P450 28d1 n=1 Tax=Drosophila willistoni TaxID=7260 RepID=UPI001F07B599|nr:probable cytochrome P450 28d1 [Drosophila willistoni]